MSTLRFQRLFGFLALLLCGSGIGAAQACATDYFLTIAGGYSPTGNQASLEANVIFFQQLLVERHPGDRRHEIFFADGDDPAPDLQIVEEKPDEGKSPATDLLASLHRRRGDDGLAYRNHRIEGVAGLLDPRLIRRSLETLAQTARPGDRLIIYVTAHGSEGPEDDEYNTTIDCWSERKIKASQFAAWLDKLPTDLPVIMVMAQCYCGGFARTIFEDLDDEMGLAAHPRVGFFAQQHDLPAAGCRPDIEHDEEFSSYFWGAIAGRTRNGVPIEGADIDGNGIVSFAEAYAHAVIAGETVDIPLRTSEVMLRSFSRLPDGKSEDSDKSDEPVAAGDSAASEDTERRPLVEMTGKLETLIAKGDPVSRHIITQLAKRLDLSLQDDVATVTKAYEDGRRASRRQGRGRGPRQSSGRRELLRDIAEKWPELGDGRKWRDSSLLKADHQEKLLAEIKELPSWKVFEERREQAEEADKTRDQAELRTVKLRRLLNTLEVMVLEQNLPLVASPEIVTRYRQMLTLEGSTLQPPPRR